MTYTVVSQPGVDTPVKAWISGVHIEPEAQAQIFNVARLPFMYKCCGAVRETIAVPFSVTTEVVNCHHNYVARETSLR